MNKYTFSKILHVEIKDGKASLTGPMSPFYSIKAFCEYMNAKMWRRLFKWSLFEWVIQPLFTSKILSDQ